MKTAIVYVYPDPQIDQRAENWSFRFLETYYRKNPGMDHDTVIVLNGGKPTYELMCLFSSLRKTEFLEHDDSGWDIGAFQRAARTFPDYDLMVFFTTSVYFKNPGWLRHMVNAVERKGDGLYGCMGNRGVPQFKVFPHVRTTGFFIRPKLMNEYPRVITTKEGRYEFEHGPNCLSEWLKGKGLQTRVVTTNGVYEWKDWDNIPNGYHRGNQSAMLCGDRLTEPPYYPVP